MYQRLKAVVVYLNGTGAICELLLGTQNFRQTLRWSVLLKLLLCALIKEDMSFLGFQMILDYESPEVIPQGRNIAEFGVDMAIRKDFLKNKKASFTFAVNDLFNSQKWGAVYDTDRFYQDFYRRWNVRSFRATFSYKFGDSNFSLFNGGNKGGESDND